MKKLKLTQVNVFFKVAEPLYSEIVGVSQEIKKKYKTTNALDKKRFLPHLSLYLFALPTKNFPELIKKAKEIATEMKSIKLEVENVIQEKNLIMLRFKKSNILYQYHLKVLNAFNSLREGVQRKKYVDEKAINKLENKHRKYLKRYGCKYILDLYHPHITIARFENENDCKRAIKNVKDYFKNKKTKLEALQIIEDYYETSNAIKLVFNQKL